MAEDKNAQLEAYAKILELVQEPLENRPAILQAASDLMDLGWPSNWIDGQMIRRHQKGLVPPYTGHQSYSTYKTRWFAEDREWEAEQEKLRATFERQP